MTRCPYDPRADVAVAAQVRLAPFGCPICGCPIVGGGRLHPPCDPDVCDFGDSLSAKLIEARTLALRIREHLTETRGSRTSVWTLAPADREGWLARRCAGLARLVLEATGEEPLDEQ